MAHKNSKQHKPSILAFTFALASICVFCPPSQAGDEATDQAVVDLIRHANLVNASYKLTASISNDEALITTQKKPKETDAECKIQAVLIAKTAFEAIPGNIQRVKVLFLDYAADASSSVQVSRAEVKLFGSGAMSEKDLLSSIIITNSGASTSASSGNTAVQAGPAQTDRLLLLGRIENLKKQGTNVSAFMSYFNQIEEAAKSGDEKSVNEKVAYLRDHVSEQEKMVKQAHAVSSGVHSSAIGGGGGAGAGTTGSNLMDSVARQFSAGQIDQGVMNFALREISLKNQMLKAKGNTDIGADQKKLEEVDSLMNSHQIDAANKIMTQLEAKYRQ